MCPIPHLRISLLIRFVKFYNKLKLCRKPEIRHLLYLQQNDNRSVFGINCINICKECNKLCVDQISNCDIVMPIQIHENDKWRIPFLNDLVNLRDNFNTNISSDDIRSMINFLATD